jgi:DNA-directed RNA polymerase specialized sigma24 family protein
MTDTNDMPADERMRLQADTLAELREVADLVEHHAGELRRLVARARNRRGLSLRQIADAAGRSVETVRTWSRDDG